VEHLKQGANPGNFCGCPQELEATVDALVIDAKHQKFDLVGQWK
jgi:hypothetical protein